MDNNITINVARKLFGLGYNEFVLSNNIDNSAENFSKANPGLSTEEAKAILTNILNDIEEKIVIVDDDVKPNTETNNTQNLSTNSASDQNPNNSITVTSGGFKIKFTLLNDNGKYEYSYSETDKILTITADNCKVEIDEAANRDAIIKLLGSNVDFYSNVQVKAINSYASDSKITGSKEKDVINNRGNNTTIFAGEGNDIIGNFAQNAKIFTSDGNDYIFNYEGGSSSTLDGGLGNDNIVNNASNVTINALYDTDNVQNKNNAKNVTIHATNITKINDLTKSASVDFDMNLSKTEKTNLLTDLFMSLFGAGNTHDNEFISSDVINSVNLLIQYLFEEGDGEDDQTLTLNEIGEYVIRKGALETNTEIDENDTELLLKQLEAGIKYIAGKSSNGVITFEDLKSFVQEMNSNIDINTYLTENFVKKLGVEISDEEYSYLKNHNNSAKLAQSINNFYNSIEKLMKDNNITELSAAQKEKIKQLLPVIDLMYYYNAAEIVLNDNYTIDENLLKDIEMVLKAQDSENPNEYIKSQMIKKGENTNSLFSSTKAGDVGEINGELYVNDGTKMVKLNIDADTYLSLFPPMQRYIVEQGYQTSDCFLLATGAIPLVETGKGFAKLLQMFKKESNGDITLTIPGYSDYPVTFKNGKVYDVDNTYYLSGMKISNGATGVNSCIGITMLEQAYALARFGETHNASISDLDIDKAFEYIYNGHGNLDGEKKAGGLDYEAYDLLLGNKENTTKRTAFTNSKTDNYALLDNWSKELKAGDTVISTAILKEIDKETENKYYYLHSGHSYSIDSIDTVNKKVYVKNPYFGYGVMEFSYDEFINLFFGATCAKL